jgi:hypothetical protein
VFSAAGAERIMLTRRGLLSATPVALAGAAVLLSCSRSSVSYADAVAETWRRFDRSKTERRTLLREVVRYATLAPSSHNTQCWRFELDHDRIALRPDLARRCRAVDPDDHHLFVSLGCATENIVQAAAASGLHADARFEVSGDGSVQVAFQPMRPSASALFDAIPLRQSTRAAYDGVLVPPSSLAMLEKAGRGQGVHVLLHTARPRMEQILEFVLHANTIQMNDPAFMDELRSWIRFSDAQALAARDGLFSRASGNPALPAWLGNAAFKLVFRPKGENDKYAGFIRSSAGIAVFVSDASDKQHWIEAGRCYERFALQATALGIRTAMINQPIEVSRVRGEFAAALGITAGRPDLIVRFGYGPEMPRSLRRPVEAVIA